MIYLLLSYFLIIIRIDVGVAKRVHSPLTPFIIYTAPSWLCYVLGHIIKVPKRFKAKLCETLSTTTALVCNNCENFCYMPVSTHSDVLHTKSR